jgi:PAS domain-containing protein
VQTVQLLLLDIDLNAYRDRTSLIAFCAATCFGVMTVLLAYMWGSNVMQRRELTVALEAVAEVMTCSPAPYLRLDSQDRIKDVSASFCALVGTAPTSENVAAVKLTTFRSYCADALSQAEYDRVESKRRKGLSVEPYTLELRKKDQSTVRVRVHSAALPTEQAGLPETFGILVEQSSTPIVAVLTGRGEHGEGTLYEKVTKQ